MTEIQFLVKLMLDETASNEIKTKCAQRIDELEQLRANQNIFGPGLLPHTYNPIIIPNFPLPHIGPTAADSCQHEYPTLWGGTMPPACTKCGKQISTNGHGFMSAGATTLTLAK